MSRIWFITGSSRGLGRSITVAALRAGDRVVATARNPKQLDDLVMRFIPSRWMSPTTSRCWKR
jgi:NAD(P)-dependent dehydrogenase (short-subunit alcohol dehydrogenase family)